MRTVTARPSLDVVALSELAAKKNLSSKYLLMKQAAKTVLKYPRHGLSKGNNQEIPRVGVVRNFVLVIIRESCYQIYWAAIGGVKRFFESAGIKSRSK